MLQLPILPGTHEGMLQNRQLIRIFTQFIQQLVRQLGIYRRSPDSHRAFNGLPEILTGHLGDQVIALIDQRSKILVHGTFPDEIGPHGDHRADGCFGICTGFMDYRDKNIDLFCLLPVRSNPVIPEDLLELVHHH